MALVDAIWVGPSGYQLPVGTVLDDGTTVHQVPEFEALDSDNWTLYVPPRQGNIQNSGSGGTE